MNTATVAEIGRSPSTVLSSREPSIVTNNGRAQNIIVNVTGLDIDEVVDLARSMQAKASLAALRRAARRNGASGLSPEDIDAEIAEARSAR